MAEERRDWVGLLDRWKVAAGALLFFGGLVIGTWQQVVRIAHAPDMAEQSLQEIRSVRENLTQAVVSINLLECQIENIPHSQCDVYALGPNRHIIPSRPPEPEESP